MSNPAEAEASGQEVIEAAFSGITFRVPLDVDSWPLETIRRCRLATPDGLAVHSVELVNALKVLLGYQWPAFVATTRRGDLVAASHVFAAAVGIPASYPSDVVFGGIPRLLALLDTWPRKAESDLDRFWGLDYRDRWRFEAGRRRLTLRQIYSRLCEGLPVDSSLATAINGGKLPRTGAEIVLMDVYEAITHTRHPSRPMPIEDVKARDAQKAAEDKARADYAERQAQRNAKQVGLEKAKANARISQRGTAHAQNET